MSTSVDACRSRASFSHESCRCEVVEHICIIIRSVLVGARAVRLQVDADGAGVECVAGREAGRGGARGCARVQVHLGGGRRPAGPRARALSR